MANSRKRLSDRANHILEAALKVFGEKGYYDATISDIAKAARVSEATLYDYFAGKEDILFSIPAKLTREGIELSDKIAPYSRARRTASEHWFTAISISTATTPIIRAWFSST